MKTMYRYEIAELLHGTILGDSIPKTVSILERLERVKAVVRHCDGLLWDIISIENFKKWVKTAGY